MPVQMLGCVLVGSQYWSRPRETSLDAEELQPLRRIGINLAWLLKNLRRDDAFPHPFRKTATRINFIR